MSANSQKNIIEPAVTRRVVYIAGKSGTVYASSTEDGTELWACDATTENSSTLDMRSSPAVFNGPVYIGSESNTMSALSNEYTESKEQPLKHAVYRLRARR